MIKTKEPVAIQVDGDPAGHTPATFDVVPGALKVIVPADVSPELFTSALDPLTKVKG
ncbi:MAG TPA: hypothetical protein VGD98_12890 [Ktedonobacteraceae bacterium]